MADDFTPGRDGDADSSEAADLDAIVDQVSASLDDAATESPDPAESPSDATAAAADDDVGDDDEQSSLDAAGPAAESPDDAAPAPEPTEAEQKLARLEAQVARERQERQTYEENVAWAQTWDNGMAYWHQAREQRRAEIFARAEQAYDKDAFLRANLTRLDQELDQGKTSWVNQFHAEHRERDRKFSQSMASRNYANYVRDELRLTKAETDQVAAFAARYPDLIDAEVARIAAAKQTHRSELSQKDLRIKELERQMAAHQLSSRTPGPGSGRRSAAKAKSLDDYLDQVMA